MDSRGYNTGCGSFQNDRNGVGSLGSLGSRSSGINGSLRQCGSLAARLCCLSTSCQSGVVEVIRLNGRGFKLEDYRRHWLPGRLLMIMPTGARTFIFIPPEGVVGRDNPDAAGVWFFPSSGSNRDEGVGVPAVFEKTRM